MTGVRPAKIEGDVLTCGVATELTDEAFEKLNALEKNERYNDPIEWGFDVFEENSPVDIEKAVKEFAAKNKK